MYQSMISFRLQYPPSNLQVLRLNTIFLHSTSYIFSGVILILLVLLTAHIIHTLYYHPLSRFPGPPLWKLTRIPYMLAMQNGTLVHRIQTFHTFYGATIRTAPDELSFTSAQAWHDIHIASKPGHTFEKNPLYMSRQKNTAHSILAAKDNDHRRIRRLISHAFSDKALREQEPVLQEYVGKLMDRLHDQVRAGWGSGEVDLTTWFSWTTFDIIGSLGFSESFNCLSSPINHHWSTMVFSHFRAASLVTSVKFFPFLEKILRWTLPAEIANRSQHFQLSKAKVHRRLHNTSLSPEKTKDLMSYVLDPKLEERMSIEEIETTFNILIIAGSETTASALAGTIHYLLLNATCLSTLTTEIRSAFQNREDITLAELGGLSYLNAVIEESLRLAPPVPSGLPRIVPSGGATVCGEYLPGGTCVSLAQYTAYRSPSNFFRADEFLPERWLHSAKEGREERGPLRDDRRHVLQPFSFGPRNCIGRNLAYAELRLVIARLLWEFDIEGVGRREGRWEEQRTFILVEKGELRVRLRVAKCV